MTADYVIIVILGHIAAIALPRAVGRQQLHCGRVASADIPVVPHVRTMYALGLDPGPGLLCTPSRIPCPVPLGGQGPRFRRGLPPQRYFSTRSNFSLSSHGQCCPGPSTDLTNHVLCLKQGALTALSPLASDFDFFLTNHTARYRIFRLK